MFFFQLAMSSSLDLGMPITPYRQTRITATMMPNRIFVLLVMFVVMPLPYGRGSVLRFGRGSVSLLSLLLFGDQAGHRATRHLQFQIVGLDAQDQRVVGIDAHNGPDDSARSQHLAAVFQCL